MFVLLSSDYFMCIVVFVVIVYVFLFNFTSRLVSEHQVRVLDRDEDGRVVVLLLLSRFLAARPI